MNLFFKTTTTTTKRLNTNVDLILSAVELFNHLNRERPFPPLKSYNHHVLNDVDQFKSCFKYHFARGSAAERTFHQKSDFERVLNAGVQLQHKQVNELSNSISDIKFYFVNLNILGLFPVLR